MDEAWEDEINGYVDTIENLLGRKLEHGYDERAKSMRLAFDPVFMIHRPLIWYIVSSTYCFESVFRINLRNRLFLLSMVGHGCPSTAAAFVIMRLQSGFKCSHRALLPFSRNRLLNYHSLIGIALINLILSFQLYLFTASAYVPLCLSKI